MNSNLFHNVIQLNTLFFVVVFFSYYFLLINTASNKKYIFLFTFILFSLIIKISIPLSEVRDFYTYTRVLSNKGHMKVRFDDFVFEPYFLLISKILLSWFSILQVLKFYYSLLFVIGMSFFIWLAFSEQLTLWKKYFIFNLFYTLFAFVLLRNGIAYVLIALFFYYLSRKIYLKLIYTSVLFHITAFPVLLFSFFRNKRINYYIIPIGLFLIALFAFLFYSKYSMFYLKFKDFKHNSIGYNYLVHNIVFILTLMISFLFFYFHKHILNNYYFVLLIFLYIILFYFNAVMGFRFSFYIILYLIMNVSLNFSPKIEKLLNKYSILFIFLGIMSVKLFLFV